MQLNRTHEKNGKTSDFGVLSTRRKAQWSLKIVLEHFPKKACDASVQTDVIVTYRPPSALSDTERQAHFP